MNVQKNLLTPNPFSRPGIALPKVEGVVIHYVGNAGSKGISNRNYFESLKDTKKTYASSHYIIGLDGEIIQCVPENEIAYCSNDRNKNTISIENCHPRDDGEFNPKTYESLVELAADICKRYNLDPVKDCIRHFDVNGKMCPLFYVKNQNLWEKFKLDVKNKLSNCYHKIMGKAELSREQFIQWFKKENIKPKINCSIEELVNYYFDVGEAESVRGDYALCQAIHETCRFGFGGIVTMEQNNYAGLGAIDGNKTGDANSFPTPKDGIIAQIQHLKGYASTDKLKLPLKDLRYKYINPLGSSPYLEWLSIPNNPNKSGWASDSQYFSKIINIYNDVAKIKALDINEALDILMKKKVITSLDYWRENYGKLQYLDKLIINMANVISD